MTWNAIDTTLATVSDIIFWLPRWLLLAVCWIAIFTLFLDFKKK